MRLGIFAKTFVAADVGGVMQAVRDAGFTATQFNMACLGLEPMPAAIPRDVAQAVRAAALAAGIEVAAVSGTFNMIHPDDRVRATGLERLAVLAAACKPMGTALVTLCTGTRDPDDMWRRHPDNDGEGAWRDLVAAMEAAIAIAETHGIELGIEPELANVVSSAVRARRLVDELGSPRLRIVLDPANLIETETGAAQQRVVGHAIDLLADRIAMVHAKDRLADGTFATAGSGILDYPFYLRRLADAGFDGPLVTHGLSAAEAPAVAAFLEGQLA